MENMYPKNPNSKWFIELTDRLKRLSDKLALPEDVASEFKVFMLEVARGQYMAGNRSGIRWAREQAGLPVSRQ